MNKEEKKREDLMDLLDIIILMIMLVEKLEVFQMESHYNKMQIKLATQKLLKLIVPIAERDFNIVFKSDQVGTNGIIREYENIIAQLRDLSIPQKIVLSQMIQAFNIDKKTVEATVHRILNKRK